MDEKRALELYKLFKQQSSTALSTYHSSIQHYRALILAILGVSIAAATTILQMDRALLVLLVLCSILIGLFINTLLCWLAIKSCDRAYRSFLEAVAIQAKLEPAIGLVGRRQQTTEDTEDAIILFPQDENIIPKRWIAEQKKFPAAEEFVKAHMNKGSNKVSRWVFRLLGFANVIFIALILLGIIASLLTLLTS
jgi:hypothetical protein